jgi:hypothetical protein
MNELAVAMKVQENRRIPGWSGAPARERTLVGGHLDCIVQARAERKKVAFFNQAMIEKTVDFLRTHHARSSRRPEARHPERLFGEVVGLEGPSFHSAPPGADGPAALAFQVSKKVLGVRKLLHITGRKVARRSPLLIIKPSEPIVNAASSSSRAPTSRRVGTVKIESEIVRPSTSSPRTAGNRGSRVEAEWAL